MVVRDFRRDDPPGEAADWQAEQVREWLQKNNYTCPYCGTWWYKANAYAVHEGHCRKKAEAAGRLPAGPIDTHGLITFAFMEGFLEDLRTYMVNIRRAHSSRGWRDRGWAFMIRQEQLKRECSGPTRIIYQRDLTPDQKV